MKIVGRTDPGQVRPANEDAYAYDRARQVAVLADGMGGLNAGEVASQEAVQSFLELLGEPLDQNSLEHAVRGANEHVFALSRANPDLSNMGTTLVACALDGAEQWLIAHVGDSRAYLFRDGELELLTSDHSVVQQLVDQGVISPDEAWQAPNRHIITRAVGLEPDVTVELNQVARRNGDLILLCSDGLSDLIQDDAIAHVLRDSPTLAAAADQLVSAANRAGGTDNITVLLVQSPRIMRP